MGVRDPRGVEEEKRWRDDQWELELTVGGEGSGTRVNWGPTGERVG